jgi:hypothetical protein
VRAGWQQFTPVAGHSFYVVAGSGPGDATPTEGFGFKGLSSGLKGVTLQNGIETEVDLSTPMPVDIFFNLLAIRRTSSVEFFVNGIFKGSSSTNLPAVSRNGYVVRASNDGTAPMPANVSVGFLTIGIPMF